MAPGNEFVKIFALRNTGLVPWAAGTRLVAVGGDYLSDYEGSQTLPSVAPGAIVHVAVDMRAPLVPNTYTAFFRMSKPDGTRFGQRVWCAIEVVDLEDEIDHDEDEQAIAEAENENDEENDEVNDANKDEQLEAIERDLLVSFEAGKLESAAADIRDSAVAGELQELEEQQAEEEQAEGEQAEAAEEEKVEEPPQFLFASQLRQLSSMGFVGGDDEDKVKSMLNENNGNVLEVVQKLLADADAED